MLPNPQESVDWITFTEEMFSLMENFIFGAVPWLADEENFRFQMI